MLIDPFWAGVLCTLAAEGALFVGGACLAIGFTWIVFKFV